MYRAVQCCNSVTPGVLQTRVFHYVHGHAAVEHRAVQPRFCARGSAFVLLIESSSDVGAMDWAGIEDEKITFLPSMIGVTFKKPRFYLSYALTLILSTYLSYEQQAFAKSLSGTVTYRSSADVAPKMLACCMTAGSSSVSSL